MFGEEESQLKQAEEAYNNGQEKHSISANEVNTESVYKIVPPNPDGDFLGRSFYLIPDCTYTLETGPIVERGTQFKFDEYTARDFLTGDYGYGINLQDNTITTAMMGIGFRTILARIAYSSPEVYDELIKLAISDTPGKLAFIRTHGDIQASTGRWRLYGETPLLYADPVIFQLSEQSERRGYNGILIASCNPAGIQVNMENVKIPVFATSADNTPFGSPMVVHRPQISHSS